MNQAQQAERAIRIARSAERRLSAHVPTTAPRGDLEATYSWALASALATIATWQIHIGRMVGMLTTELNSDRRTRETVSDLLAYVRLSNVSLTDYFALVESKSTVTKSVGRDGYVTVKRLSDAELWALASAWNTTHGTRASQIAERTHARHAAERKAQRNA
jgi:hypothetical protein